MPQTSQPVFSAVVYSVLLLVLIVFIESVSSVTLTTANGIATQTPSPTPTDEPTLLCKVDNCRVDKVSLNTGYDQIAGALYAPVQPDAYWELIDAPKTDLDGDHLPDGPGTTTTLTLPSPPWVISPNGAWSNFPDSNWISAYQTNALDTNNQQPIYAPYAFQRCFCTCEGVKSVLLDLTVLADNTADVTFDGGPSLGSMLSNSTANFRTGLKITKEIPVQPGRHCLRVDVRNISLVAMGLNVNGTVTSVTPGEQLFLSASCCIAKGKIIGRKFDDVNCNGNNDNLPDNQTIEPGLPGWLITLRNTATGATATATTDANGMYYFNSLPPGTYEVSETIQGGWTQTLPSGTGNYTVTLAAGQVLQRDFGNCKKAQATDCAIVVGREAVCNVDGSGGYTYTFTVTNNSGKDVTEILLTPPFGSALTLSRQVFSLPTTLHQGQSTTITVGIGNVNPATRACFFVTLMTKDGPCCTVEVCPVLPECCATATGTFQCSREGYTGTFSIVNTSQNEIRNIYLYPPPGVTLGQTYFAVSLGPGQTFTTPPMLIKGAKPGKLCFRVSMHTADMKDCCVVEMCVTLPQCTDPRASSSVLNTLGAVQGYDSRRGLPPRHGGLP
jgi:hypothetical protein